MSEARRLAFVRLLIGGMMNNPVDQLAAMRDLGALPTTPTSKLSPKILAFSTRSSTRPR